MTSGTEIAGAVGTCESCGKDQYLSKQAAKSAIRQLRARQGRNHPYRCGDYWHHGHMPAVVKAGLLPRAELEPKVRP